MLKATAVDDGVGDLEDRVGRPRYGVEDRALGRGEAGEPTEDACGAGAGGHAGRVVGEADPVRAGGGAVEIEVADEEGVVDEFVVGGGVEGVRRLRGRHTGRHAP